MRGRDLSGFAWHRHDPTAKDPAEMQRRNVATVREGHGSSIWEKEASQYWNEMEPSKWHRKVAMGGLVLVLVTAGWVLLAPHSQVSQAPHAADPTILSSVSTTATSSSPPVGPEQTEATLRARCRHKGVQSRWHEETCRKLCAQKQLNAACMNGCSYGTMGITKATCDLLDVKDLPSAAVCPSGDTNCVMACKAYENQQPSPDLRRTCENACVTIIPPSCTRILEIFRDLYRSSATD